MLSFLTPTISRSNLSGVPIAPEQFRTLALGELQAVYRLAIHLARNPADADDLVQETFVRAFKSEDTFRLSESGVRPWLLKILHNVFLTKLKRPASNPSPPISPTIWLKSAMKTPTSPAKPWPI